MNELDLAQVGERIRQLRGALTQAAFAERLGLERKSVGRYEAGDRAPDALALLRLMAEFGADPAWVLTGGGAGPSISPDERELLALFRAAPLAVKAAAIGALQGGAQAGAGRSHQVTITASGRGTQAAGRKIINKGGKS